MSEYNHTAVIVTGHERAVLDARSYIARLTADGPSRVTTITPGRNGFDSFMLAPSGAGSLHASADAHAQIVSAFIDYLRPIVDLDWIAVTFGREHGPAEVLGDCADAKSRAGVRWRKG